jgi:folate-binding protein YgfZ
VELTLPELSLDPIRLARLTSGAVVVPVDHAILRVSGSGALQCLQGLLTNDLVKPGPGSITWGALLTPKGMIESDLWCLRDGEEVLVVLPRAGVAPVLATFKRSLPPRLARTEDLTGAWTSLMVIGASAGSSLRECALIDALPAPGQLTKLEGGVIVAHAPLGAPFELLVIGPAGAIAAFDEKLGKLGGAKGSDEDAEAARVLAGWPALGAEIDDKTLPQEVRFDELGGVSYTKGCYLGQETVARIHFRGHPNRELRGLEWEDALPLSGRTIEGVGRELGTVRSTLIVGGRRLGIAPIRREVAIGETVIAGGRPARVVALPFGVPRVA